MRILVTGGAGFIGSHLVEALVDRGHRVVVIDDLSVGKRENVHPRATFIKKKIQERGVERIFQNKKFGLVFHLAAQKELQFSKQHPVDDAETNIIGSLRLLAAARRYHTRKFIFFSTAAVYDSHAAPPSREREAMQPATPYGLAKSAVEDYVRFSGIRYTILRPSNVYGPRQDAFGEGGVVAIFCSRLVRQLPCRINNTGRQTRDFVYVDDVVEASLKSINRGHNAIVNISTNKETSVNQLYARLAGVAGTPLLKAKRGLTIDEQFHSALDNQRAKRVLHWRPKTSLEEGLSRTYQWFQVHG